MLNGNKQWIGETPQDVILSPGLNRLVLGFFGTVGDGKEPDKLGVDVILHRGRAGVDALNYDIDSSRLTESSFNNRPPPTRTSTLEQKLDYLRAGADQADRARERARLEFISFLRKRYPVSSVLSPRENGLPALEVPRPPDPPEGGKGGPMSIGSTAYRKIQIDSDPMGASIMLDGERHGTTPQTIVMQRSEIKLILRKPGFLDIASEIKLTEPITVIRATLNPIP